MKSNDNNSHNHAPGVECDACKYGLATVEAKQDQAMEQHGWYAHVVLDDPDTPSGVNIHTHGLAETQKHPDLQICVRVHPQAAHDILITAIEDFIKKGKPFEAGKKYDGLIAPTENYKNQKYEVLFLEAKENGRKVLRLIFPDKDGSFDGPLGKKQIKGCILPEGINLK